MPYHSIDDPESLKRLLSAVISLESSGELDELLERVTSLAVELSGARYGALGVLGMDGARIDRFITVGMTKSERDAIGHEPEGKGVLGFLIDNPEPLRLDDLSKHPYSCGFPAGHPPMRSFLGAPVRSRGKLFGVVFLTDKNGGEPFSDKDEDLVTSLTAAASLAIESARLHDHEGQLALMKDRDRIARDLHDTVIQRLFAIGLDLEGTTRLSANPSLNERIERAVTDLDETIRQIRTTIFSLGRQPSDMGLRAMVSRVCEEMSSAMPARLSLAFEGTIETLGTSNIASDALATLREALSNVSQHANADCVEVLVKGTAQGELILEVTDDGVGIGETPGQGTTSPEQDSFLTNRGHGLLNIAERAKSHGGTLTIGPSPSGKGTRLRWEIPLQS